MRVHRNARDPERLRGDTRLGSSTGLIVTTPRVLWDARRCHFLPWERKPGREAEEITLAYRDALVAQDVVGGGEVEIEIRKNELQEILLTRQRHFQGREIEDHFASGAVLHIGGATVSRKATVLATRWRNSSKVFSSSGKRGTFDRGQPTDQALARIADALHLAGKRQHVRRQPGIDEIVGEMPLSRA